MSYQPGDHSAILGDRRYKLRLTMGGLAEISHRLDAQGPMRLSQQIKRDAKSSFAVILEVMLQADGASDVLKQASQSELIEAIKSASKLISEVFSDDSKTI